jgi:threonine dehydrogenase-like Zn-dependent dehydrogenase
LFILQGARLRGAAKVIAVDIDEFRLDTAKKLGADALVNPLKSDLKDRILELTEGQGVHVAWEAVGYAKTFADAVSVTKLGGHVVAVGNLEKTAEFDLQELVARS